MLKRKPLVSDLPLDPSANEDEYFRRQDEQALANLRKNKPKPKPTHVTCTWDWKSAQGAFETIKRELPKLGLHVYENPACEGSDAFG